MSLRVFTCLSVFLAVSLGCEKPLPDIPEDNQGQQEVAKDAEPDPNPDSQGASSALDRNPMEGWL